MEDRTCTPGSPMWGMPSGTTKQTTVAQPGPYVPKNVQVGVTVPTVEAELADLATRQIRSLPSGGSMEIAFLEEDGLHTFIITKIEVF